METNAFAEVLLVTIRSLVEEVVAKRSADTGTTFGPLVERLEKTIAEQEERIKLMESTLKLLVEESSKSEGGEVDRELVKEIAQEVFNDNMEDFDFSGSYNFERAVESVIEDKNLVEDDNLADRVTDILSDNNYITSDDIDEMIKDIIKSDITFTVTVE